MARSRVTFGESVREARTSTTPPMPLRELARRLEVAPSYVNDIENDRRVPSEAVIQKICQIFELDIDQMMSAAGRVGSIPETYLRSEPKAGALFRKVAGEQLGESELDELIRQAETLARKRPGSDSPSQ